MILSRRRSLRQKAIRFLPRKLQRILQNVLRVLGVSAHPHAEAIHLRLVALEEGLQRLPVSRSRRREQAFVRRLGCGHDLMLPDGLPGEVRTRVEGDLDRRRIQERPVGGAALDRALHPGNLSFVETRGDAHLHR